MNGDSMRGKQRAWICAGCGYFVDPAETQARVMLAEGERPVLVMPPGLDPDEFERCFGWAMTETMEQTTGWLAVLRAFTWVLDERAKKVA